MRPLTGELETRILVVADGHPFVGIAKKLERANENVLNLHREIESHFQGGDYPVIPKPDNRGWQAAVDYHRNRQVPVRFSVLAGEIVHHLRSCLDHIVWHFAPSAARQGPDGRRLEFPIFREKPIKKEEVKAYERKIKGITNSRVLDLIEKFQPYNRMPDPGNDALFIVYDLDRIDKHRELLIVDSCANVVFPPETPIGTISVVMAYRNKELLSAADTAIARRAIKDAPVFPQVAFAEFGEGKTKFVIPSLVDLLNSVSNVAAEFGREA